MDDEGASVELLTKVAELWITVHGFASARAYVEAYKTKNNSIWGSSNAHLFCMVFYMDP